MNLDRIFLDPDRVSDADLAAIRPLVLRLVLPIAPALADFIHGWIDAEQGFRRTGQPRPAKHIAAPPPLDRWTDRQVGEALNAILQIHFDTSAPEPVAELFDRWLVMIGGWAASRLAGELPERVAGNHAV